MGADIQAPATVPGALVRPPGPRGLAVAGVTLAANLGTFGFLVVVARSGTPAVLSGAAALAAVALAFEVPANALQAAIGARGQAGGDVPGLRSSVLTMSAVGAATCALLVALAP